MTIKAFKGVILRSLRNPHFLLLTAIILIGVGVRLKNFQTLPIDAHAMRQTETESVAYNFAFRSANILLPQQGLIRPMENVNSYYFMEFPLYAYMIAVLYKLFGWRIVLARFINLLLFITGVGSLHYFVEKFINKNTALIAAFLFTFTPASIFFLGHAIHPDILSVTTLLLALALYMKYVKSKNNLFFLLSLINLSLSVATRPFILIVLPAFLSLLWFHKARLWEYIAISFGSLFFYGLWNLWEFWFRFRNNYHWTTSEKTWILGGRAELFKKEVFVRQLLLKNVTGEVIGKTISLAAGLGVVSLLLRRNRISVFLFAWLMGIPVYWLLVPNGNIVHQYYANVYIIPVILTAACGLVYTYEKMKKFVGGALSTATFVPLALLIIYNGIHTANHFFKFIITTDLPIANEIQKVVPIDDKLVYLGNNSVPFSLYHRGGWMLGAAILDIEPSKEAIFATQKLGAKYIVEGKGDTIISDLELSKIKEATDLVYSSSLVNIYQFRE